MKKTQPQPYSITLKDKARNYDINVTDYPVKMETGRKFYYQFFKFWGKRIKFQTCEGETVEGYLHKVKGEYF